MAIYNKWESDRNDRKREKDSLERRGYILRERMREISKKIGE